VASIAFSRIRELPRLKVQMQNLNALANVLENHKHGG